MEPMDTQERIKEQVTGNRVMLYMKGTPQAPQCGFSALAVQVLNACGVREFGSVNVLADPAIREGVKNYSSWPTIPQLYVEGEFIGGCDIVKQLYASGELSTKLAPYSAPVSAPKAALARVATARPISGSSVTRRATMPAT